MRTEGLTCVRAADGKAELIRHSRFGAFSVTTFVLRGLSGEVCVTTFALLAKKRAFWAVLRVRGEFCPVLATSKLSRESFVPQLPGWRLPQNLWSSAVRCWDWSPRPWAGSATGAITTGAIMHADR